MASHAMMRLVIEDHEGRREAVPLELGEATVGRDENNSIRLNERNVSRRHIRIQRTEEQVIVEDLDSYNGVFINDDRLCGRCEVHEGDVLRVGDFQLELHSAHDGRSAAENTEGSLPRLVGLSSSVFGVEYEISTDEAVIGRVAGNAIAIDHRSVSRQHAKIMVDGDTFRLVDLNSANGTLVNGKEYTEVELRSGDLLELGHVRLCFVGPGEEFSGALEEHAICDEHGADSEECLADVVDSEQWSRPTKSSRLRMGLLLMLAALAIVGVSAKVFFLGDRETSVDDEADAEIAVLAAQGSGAVSELSEHMTAALVDKDWHRADEIADTILVLDEDHAWAKEVQRLAMMEIESRESYERALRLSQQERFAEAHDAWELVAPESDVAEEAEALMSVLGNSAASGSFDSDKKKQSEPNVRALLAEAVEWILIDEPKRALDPLQSCVEIHPNYCRCHRALGIVHAKLQDPVSAERSYRSYIELCPDAKDVEQIAQMLNE